MPKFKKKNLITQFSFHYLCSSRVLPYNQSPAKYKPKTQILTKPQTYIPVKQTLAFKPINFLGKQTQKKPAGKKNPKSPPPNQRT